jgi:hypothetical protein
MKTVARRKRKIPAVDQFEYMKARGGSQCDLKVESTDHDRLLIIINQKCAYPDNEETFQTISALARCGAAQWGEDWLDRVRNYLNRIKVIK